MGFQIALTRARIWLAAAALLLAAAFAVTVGCSAGDVEVAETPAAQQLTQSTRSPQADSAASGQLLFANNCALCHGADLRGTASGPSLLHEYYEPNHHSNASFVIAVLRGVRAHHWDFGNMPAVAGLDIDQVHAVICFIREAQLEDGLIAEIPTSTPC